jgi:hypothetical protein
LVINSVSPAYAAGIFNDVDEGYWAERPIALVALSGLIRGYSDGTFKPNRPLSQLEAIVLIERSLLPEQDVVRAISRNVSYPEYGIKHSGGYLLLALEKGIIKREEISGGSLFTIASRQDVARYIYRSMIAENHLSVITKNVYPDLQFLAGEDADAISAVTNAGLMGGKLNGIFAPGEALDRASMASLVCRMHDFSGKQLPNLYRRVGSFVAFDEDAKQAVIFADQNQTLSLQLASASRLYDQGVQVSWSQLLEGRLVYAWLDHRGKLQIAEALPVGFVPFMADHYFLTSRGDKILAADLTGGDVLLEGNSGNSIIINGIEQDVEAMAFGDGFLIDSEDGDLFNRIIVQRTMARPVFEVSGQIMAVDFNPNQLALLVGRDQFKELLTIDVPQGVVVKDSSSRIVELKDGLVGAWGKIKGKVVGESHLRRMQAQEIFLVQDR